MGGARDKGGAGWAGLEMRAGRGAGAEKERLVLLF